MANPYLTSLPTFTDSVQRDLIIEPLLGPRNLDHYLARFPEEIYNRAPDSHFIRFMSVLLGQSGVNWLRQNYLDARVLLEEIGIDAYDLDSFFGDPFTFGRILDEDVDFDPNGLITKAQYEAFRVANSKYRNRAIDFVNAARAGTTPLGMRLASRAGLGHDVEIIENYKYLYDSHSDSPQGVVYQGKTLSTEEFVIIPRREVAMNETQRVIVSRDATTSLGGTFVLVFNGEATSPIAWNATSDTVRLALEALKQIAVGDVWVTGGPSSSSPTEALYGWNVTFLRNLGGRDIPELQVLSALTNSSGGSNPTASMAVTTTVAGLESADAPVNIPPRDQHSLQIALDRIRPVATVPTFSYGSGSTSRTLFNSVFPTSEYKEVLRYVTGTTTISWPTRSNVFWIEKGVEHEAPRYSGDLQHHYKVFHNVADIRAYTDSGAETAPTDYTLADANKSEHIGNYNLAQVYAFPFLADAPTDQATADKALADYPEALLVTNVKTVDGKLHPVINGIYPTEYQSLPGIPTIRYKDEQFWASLERETGDEYLEIDLGSVQAVNFLTFEVTRKPVTISVEYDLLDASPARSWKAVTPVTPYSNEVFPGEGGNPWHTVELAFWNSKNEIIFTRFLRIKISRREDPLNPFLHTTDPFGQEQAMPWSVDVRNLRLGRNVS
jgi:hypothetical protein